MSKNKTYLALVDDDESFAAGAHMGYAGGNVHVRRGISRRRRIIATA